MSMSLVLILNSLYARYSTSIIAVTTVWDRNIIIIVSINLIVLLLSDFIASNTDDLTAVAFALPNNNNNNLTK